MDCRTDIQQLERVTCSGTLKLVVWTEVSISLQNITSVPLKKMTFQRRV